MSNIFSHAESSYNWALVVSASHRIASSITPTSASSIDSSFGPKWPSLTSCLGQDACPVSPVSCPPVRAADSLPAGVITRSVFYPISVTVGSHGDGVFNMGFVVVVLLCGCVLLIRNPNSSIDILRMWIVTCTMLCHDGRIMLCLCRTAVHGGAR